MTGKLIKILAIKFTTQLILYEIKIADIDVSNFCFVTKYTKKIVVKHASGIAIINEVKPRITAQDKHQTAQKNICERFSLY